MLEQWWKRAGYSRVVVGETGRRAWRGACERREAFTRVGVKVWSMVPWLRQGPGVRLWGHAMPNWQRGLCQYPEPRAQNPHLRPVGLLLEWDRDRGRDRD